MAHAGKQGLANPFAQQCAKTQAAVLWSQTPHRGTPMCSTCHDTTCWAQQSYVLQSDAELLPRLPGLESEAPSWFTHVYPLTQAPHWPHARPLDIIQACSTPLTVLRLSP